VREFPDVIMLSSRRISSSHAERLARAVGCALARREITGGARVRLKTGNCGRGPMVVQVNLRVRDTPARVMAVTAGTGDLAPALARLDRQVESMLLPWRPRPWPDLTHRMLTVEADAVVARRKSVLPQRLTPLQAVEVMDAMDYDAHLFTDAETGEDAVVYRAGPSGLRLARQHQVFPPGWSWSSNLSVPPVPLVVNSRPTPALTEAAAVRRIGEHRARLLFFTDPTSGRGQLLYPRYDGNLGLITPVDGGDL
jgi:hypothetical protein